MNSVLIALSCSRLERIHAATSSIQQEIRIWRSTVADGGQMISAYRLQRGAHVSHDRQSTTAGRQCDCRATSSLNLLPRTLETISIYLHLHKMLQLVPLDSATGLTSTYPLASDISKGKVWGLHLPTKGTQQNFQPNFYSQLVLFSLQPQISKLKLQKSL